MQVLYDDTDYQRITDSLIITPLDYPHNCVNERGEVNMLEMYNCFSAFFLSSLSLKLMASILHSDFSPAFWCNSICSTKPLLVGHSQYTFKFLHIFIVKYSLITGKSAMKFFDKEMAVLFETFSKNHPFRTDLSFASFFSLRTWCGVLCSFHARL